MTATHLTTVARRRDAGFSLLQLAIAVPLFAVLALGLGEVMASTSRHQATAQTTAVAIAAMRDKVAEIQHLANQDAGAVYATYTQAVEHSFAVPAIPGVRPGLRPLPGSTTVGRVFVWNDETGASGPSGATSADAVRLGLPLDLNLDDDALDDNLVSYDMKLIPVKITLDFLDVTGPRHVEVYYLAGRQP